MSELTRDHVTELQQITEFLERAQRLGVYLPVPTIDLGDQVKFRFSPYALENWYTLSEERRSEMVVEQFKAAAKAIGGRWAKNDPKASQYDDNVYLFTHDGVFFGDSTKLVLAMDRDMICERVQVGTETKVIPAVEAQPERTEEVPIFERECKPLNTRTEAVMANLAAELESGEDVVDAEVVA